MEFAAGIPLWMCRYSMGYGAMRTLGHVVNMWKSFYFTFCFDFLWERWASYEHVRIVLLFVLILVLNAVVFFSLFFLFGFSLRFCMLFYINKFSFLFCFWFWFWYYWNAFVIFFTCSFFHSDFACYFTSINFLFCFTLFSVLKFSLFDYVEIKIIKKL